MPVKTKDVTTRTRTVRVKGTDENGWMTVADVQEFADELKAAGVPGNTIVKVPCTYTGYVAYMAVRAVEARPTR